MVKRVNIDLRKELHSQAKIISILKNISLNKYLEDCIEKALQDDQVLLHAFTHREVERVDHLDYAMKPLSFPASLASQSAGSRKRDETLSCTLPTSQHKSERKDEKVGIVKKDEEAEDEM